MNPRSTVALVIGLLAAAAALVFGLLRQVGVKSYGAPAGRVVRAGNQLAVVMGTRDPYLPSLKGASESTMTYSYELWLIPESGSGDVRKVRLDRSVSSSKRTHNIGAQHFENGVLWYTISDLQGIDVASGKKTTTAAPASLVNMPISQLMGTGDNPLEPFRSTAATLPSGEWLILASDDEAKSSLKPGTRLYDNPTATGTYLARKLHLATVQPGPIPRLAAATRLSDKDFRNGSLLRSAKDGAAIRFANPDGFLVVHQAGDAVHPTLHLSRVNVDGSIAWTANTTIGRLTQVLPHDTYFTFVGEVVPTPTNPIEPIVAVVNVKDGTVQSTSLKGPLN